MPLDKPIFIVRRKPRPGDDDIPIDEWLSYIHSSSILYAKERTARQGINPFTKSPSPFSPSPGGASFEGPKGRCEIEYHAGGLIFHNANGHAEEIVARIAEDLGASVEFYDPNAGRRKGDITDISKF
ncbi:MAG TPA: hypothetical protein VFE58_12185 [Tepidisphaeraceae bacterium]|jgi:hypothetical protein|nr:hypothetical protein [Tepidisphaeraceae bacterium]